AAKQEFVGSGKEMATRQASGAVLNHLFDAIPELLGGSADLTPSNNTKAKNQVEIRPGEYKGSYVHYGVREHGMAAAMNGISLHGGLIPYGGPFMCFSDYCRPSIRLAALMRVRTISRSSICRRCAPFRPLRCIARAIRSRPPSVGRRGAATTSFWIDPA